MKNKGLVSIIAIILGLLAGALLMALIGSNPIEGYSYLIKGSLSNIEKIGNTIATATPLILTGLSVAFAFKTGLFNIGAAGQMLFGGFCSTVVALSVHTSTPILLILMVIAGALGGAVWGLIPGLLKAKFNVHEVVSTIMMNWISYEVIYYLVPKYFKGSVQTESKKLTEGATLASKALSKMFNGSYINLGIVVAIVSVIVIAFILNKTTLGYELKAVGFNRFGAEYAGIGVNKNIILAMMISGALAGLAGVTQYTGNANVIQIGVMPSQGYDGIAVALLASNGPFGVLLSALFFGVLYTGRGFMNAMTSIPQEIASAIIATIIYFAATSVLVERFIGSRKEKSKNKKESKVIPNNVATTSYDSGKKEE